MKISLLAILVLIASNASLLADGVSCGNLGQPEPEDPCLSGVGANPINPLMGNLHREVTDLQTFGFAPIAFTRIYNSRTTNFNSAYLDFGYKQTWQHGWNYELRDLSAKTFGIKDVKLRYPNGSEYNFKAADASGAVRAPTAEKGDRLYPWTGSPVGFTLVTPEGAELDFQRTTSPKYNLVRARDGQGVTLTFEYDSNGRLQRIANPFGRWIEIERETVDGLLRISKVRSHDGREVNYSYAAWNPTSSVVLSSVNYPGGETASYSYTGASAPGSGRPLLASASDPMYGGAGARVRYVYNYGMIFDFGHGPYLVTGVAMEERSLVTDALIVSLPIGTGEDVPVQEGSGAEIRRRFVNGLISEQIDGEGNSTSFARSAAGYGYIEASIDAAGLVTNYVRDYAGRVTAETDALGTTSHTVYNPAGFIISSTDALGRTTATTRNQYNQPTRIDYPDGNYEEWTYNDFGQPLNHRRADGGVATYSYYAIGELGGLPQDLKSQTDALGQIVSYTHSESGQVASMTDGRGFTTAFAYDWRGQELGTLYADGSLRSQVWDDWGNRMGEIDELGQVTFYTYTEYNQLASVMDPFNRVTFYEYVLQPGCGSCSYKPTLVRETRPSGRAITHTYDFRGKRTSTTEAAGTPIAATTQFAYDSLGNLVSTIDPLGGTNSVEYDALGRRVRSTNALGFATVWAYDAIGNVVSVSGPTGETVVYEYDSMNRLVRVIDPVGAVTQRAYDAAGRVVDLVDPLGNAASTDYDLEGRPVTVWNPDATSQSFEYNATGNLIRQTDELGNQTQFGYDVRGRTVDVTDPLGRTRSTTYDLAGRVIAEIAPSGRRSEYSYDQANRRVAVTVAAGTPEAASTDYTYDADGNLTSVTDAEGVSAFFPYDELGRKTLAIDASYRVTQYNYDANSRLIGIARPDGSFLNKAYDALGRLVSETNAAGHSTRYGYNPAGQLATITDARGSLTSMAYDLAGRMISKTYSDGASDVYGYDLAGRLFQETTARGIRRDYVYTARGQLNSIGYSDGTPATVSAYDAKGRVIARARGDAALFYDYDAADQLVSETQSVAGHALGSRALTYDYDADGLRTLFRYPDSSELRYQYNARGQLAQLLRNNIAVATYAYRFNGTLARRDLANGTYEMRDYDAANRMTSLQYFALSSTMLSQSVYTFNMLGQRESIDRGQGIMEFYDYNTADEVDSATYGPGDASSYFYDPSGNRVLAAEERGGLMETITYQANSINQYTQIASSSPEYPVYDADGNTTNLGGRTYTYDGQSQLTSVAPSFPVPGDVRIEYGYDALQRRVRQTEQTYQSNGSWSVSRDTFYTYDGWNVIEESTLGEPARRYTWGDDRSGSPQGAGGVGGLVTMESTTETWWYHYDGNGNVVSLTDTAGAEIAHYRYSAFGETLEANGPAAESNKYRFSTKPTDDIGLYYYGYRFYDSSLGRWLNRDPIGELGGVSLYGMIGNDPLNSIDLNGLVLYAFDGTDNDRDRDRWDNPDAPKSPTNVAIMTDLYAGTKYYKHGIGTRTNIMFGITSGLGGCERMEDMFSDFEKYFLTHPNEPIDIIGFSRGAAMARNFANLIRDKHPNANIRFLGLFDTVAQIGLPDSENSNPGYDLSIPSGIGLVAHAIAMNEYRDLFPLTSISSDYDQSLFQKIWNSGRPNRYNSEDFETKFGDGFIEKPFIGAHSDIGGGYKDGRNLFALKWLISQGKREGVPFRDLEKYKYVDRLHSFGVPHDSRYSIIDWRNNSRSIFSGNLQ